MKRERSGLCDRWVQSH